MTGADKPKSIWREYAEAIGDALVLALFIRTFIVQAFKIPSGSMIPTLLIGDHLLVNKMVYRFRPPQRGEIVVFKFPRDHKTDFIKRVVAVAGDTWELKDKTLYVNGKAVDEPYAWYEHEGPVARQFGPGVVPPGAVLVVGDNRDNSYDSRYWGPVEYKDIVGKALFIYWSWGDRFYQIRWQRIGDVIH